jgi:hypothetical protein
MPSPSARADNAAGAGNEGPTKVQHEKAPAKASARHWAMFSALGPLAELVHPGRVTVRSGGSAIGSRLGVDRAQHLIQCRLGVESG